MARRYAGQTAKVLKEAERVWESPSLSGTDFNRLLHKDQLYLYFVLLVGKNKRFLILSCL
jgi:hypothetical protein